METKQKHPTFYNPRNSPFVANLIWSSPRFSQAVILLLYYYCDWSWPLIGHLGFFSVLSLAKPIRHFSVPRALGGFLSGCTFQKMSFLLFFTNYFYHTQEQNECEPGQVGDHLVTRVLSPSARSQASGPRLRSLWPGPGSAGITGPPPLFQIGAPSHSQIWSQSSQVLTLTTIMTRCPGRGTKLNLVSDFQTEFQQSYYLNYFLSEIRPRSGLSWVAI